MQSYTIFFKTIKIVEISAGKWMFGYFSKNYTKIDECCSSQINLALKTGGQDNVTVLGVSTIEDEETSISVTFPDKIRQFFKQRF